MTPGSRDQSRFTPFLLCTLLSCGTLASCNVTPRYERPQVAAGGHYAHVESATGSRVLPRWWTLFGNQELTGLVEAALERNRDLKIAYGRIQQARAVVQANRAFQFPDVEFVPSYTRSRVSGNVDNALPKRIMRTWTVPLEASYEVDLWGRVAGEVRISQQNYLATQAAAETTSLAVASDVASAYLSLYYTSLDIAKLRQAIELREIALRLNTARRAAGVASDLDVLRAETELRTTEADLAESVRAKENLGDALAILCGVSPATFATPSTTSAVQIPSIPPGLPASLIDQRPDVYAAERQLAAANEQIGVARTAYLPSLTLTATGGFAARDLGSFLDRNSSIWSLVAGIAVSIFDGGRRDAAVTAAKAGFSVAEATFEKSVLEGLREVQDSLNDVAANREKMQLLSAAVTSATGTAKVSRSRYEHGYVSYFEVVDADRDELNVERNLIRAQQSVAVATVALIKALGGGWRPQLHLSDDAVKLIAPP